MGCFVLSVFYYRFYLRVNLVLVILFMQTISYTAERVVGTGSFGVVFQVLGNISDYSSSKLLVLIFCFFFKKALTMNNHFHIDIDVSFFTVMINDDLHRQSA